MSFGEMSRGDWIRTSDPLHPMQVRYQAAPLPERTQDSTRTESRTRKTSRLDCLCRTMRLTAYALQCIIGA